MKKLSLVLALVMAMSALVSCAGETADTTTAAPTGGDKPAAVTTTGAAKVTLPNLETDPEPTTEGDGLPYEIEAFPNAKSGTLALEGYEANGYWEDGVNTDGMGMFIFTNDTMAAGTLTITMTGVEGSPSDSGLVFGMEDDVDELIWFWENGPAYYMLFASDAGNLYLSKVNYNGQVWNNLMEVPIPNFAHGQEVTIKVEFDGAGNIKGYANGELLITYTDANPLTGNRYGVRAEISGVSYSSVIAEHN